MTAAFREVASALGLGVPVGETELRDILEAGVQQAHRLWLHG
ncbi:hypothetical protein [Streptomyces mirabilis]|nr:hypothetical protein [Streptomyces mirabilis]MCX4429644.1 hypothetical protein [Streptomyces mirabilis]